MSTDTEVVRWYTRARKFPQLIGRFDKTLRIPGGPYTATQAIAGAAVLVIGLKTMSWWGVFGGLMNLTVLVGAVAATVVLLGKVPLGTRGPLSHLLGLLAAVSMPRTGRLAGRAVRLPRPHTARFAVTVQPLPAPAAEPVVQAAPARRPAGITPVGVPALLARVPAPTCPGGES